MVNVQIRNNHRAIHYIYPTTQSLRDTARTPLFLIKDVLNGALAYQISRGLKALLPAIVAPTFGNGWDLCKRTLRTSLSEPCIVDPIDIECSKFGIAASAPTIPMSFCGPMQLMISCSVVSCPCLCTSNVRALRTAYIHEAQYSGCELSFCFLYSPNDPHKLLEELAYVLGCLDYSLPCGLLKLYINAYLTLVCCK